MQSSYYSCLWKRLIQKRGSWLFLFFFFSENFQWQPKILHGGGSGFRRWWSWGERSVSQQPASWRIVPRILCSILYQCWFKVSFPLNKWFLIFWSSNPGAMHIPGSLRWHLSSQGKETVKKENRVGGVAIQKKKKKSRRTSSSSDEEQRANKDTE